MKKLIIIILSLMLVFNNTTVSAEEVPSNNVYSENSINTINKTIQIYFEKDTKFNEIMNLVTSDDMIIKEIVYDDSVGDNIYTTGYVNNKQLDTETMINEFLKDYNNLLEESIININNPELRKDLIIRKERILKNKSICVKSIKANVNNNYYNQIKSNKLVNTVNLYKNQELNRSINGDIEARSTYNWAPSSGSALAMVSTKDSNSVFMNLNFKWNSQSALDALNNRTDRTFEGEIIFYNYDGNGMSTKYNDNYVYTTNLPSAYKDTQFNWGNNDEPNFSIGCSKASDLVINKTYSWTVYGNKNSSGSKAKVCFQTGHKVFDGSGSTWNIFSDETYKAVSFDQWNTTNNIDISF